MIAQDEMIFERADACRDAVGNRAARCTFARLVAQCRTRHVRRAKRDGDDLFDGEGCARQCDH